MPLTYHEAEAGLKFGDYNKAVRFLMQQEQVRLVETIAPPAKPVPVKVHPTAQELEHAGELDYTRKLFGFLETRLIEKHDILGLSDLRLIRRDFDELARRFATKDECQCQDHEERREAIEALDRSGQTTDDQDEEELAAAAAWCRS